MSFHKICLVVLLGLSGHSAAACELCAIYSADNARGASAKGFVFTAAEQFIPFRNVQNEGESISIDDPDYLENSITHLVLGYNFSRRFSLSLSVPIIYNSFQRFDLLLGTETGTEWGLGDLALISRWTIFQKARMKYAVSVSLLGGVKFPTGDTDRLKREVAEARFFDMLFPPGYAHDPIHAASGVHSHHLALGSGSFDGIFGTTLNARWQRFFFSSEFQYYLRTEGESSFQYGDVLIASGGPGGYVLSIRHTTLSLQARAVYETQARASIFGVMSDQTGLTAWYFGPQLVSTWGSNLSVQAGVDVPLRIQNNGLQAVPDFRIHGGLTWRF